MLKVIEKPGTGIYLMKESAKLHRPQKEREKKKLAKRLWAPSEATIEMLMGHRIKDRIWEEVSSHRYNHQSQETQR
jgi:hypothetical protein